MRRAAVSAALAVCFVALPVPAAFGANVAVIDGGTRVFFLAAGGEDNDVSVSLTMGEYILTDANPNPVTPSSPCVQNGANLSSVRCPAAGITSLEVNLGPLDDRAVTTPATDTVIYGGAGHDELTSSSGDDEVHGDDPFVQNGGNDTITAGDGNDELVGDPIGATGTGGQNTMDGGPGIDRLTGGSGMDTMQGGLGADTLFGFAGGDVVDGGDGNDLVGGGDGNDTMRGGAGNDTVGDDTVAGPAAEGGNDVVEGGLGDDLLRPGNGPVGGFPDNDRLSGGAGRDSLVFDKRQSSLNVSVDGVANDGALGEADNVIGDIERLLGGQAGDRIAGGPGAESIDGFRGADSIDGGGGDDTLDGGVDDADSDAVSGGPGNDVVRGNAGDDAVNGDDGNDNVQGGDGQDRLGGGAGTDALSGGNGADVANGGDGDDALDGAPGDDSLRGDAGNDLLAGADGDDRLAGGRGADRMGGGAGTDTADYRDARGDVTVTLDGRPNDGERGERDNVDTDVENVDGGGAEDTFTGSRAANTLDGGSGEDFVDGRGGRDRLRGGRSRDVVRARDGRADVVDCGRDADFAIVDRRDRVRRGCERVDLGRGRPSAGRDVVVRPVRKGVQFGLRRMRRTVPLLDNIAVPVGTSLDARDGSVSLRASGRASGTFTGAAFSVLQRRARRAVTDLRLKGGNFGRCRGGRVRGGQATAAQLRRRTIRRLRARARGRFRTRGRYSAATVRGTVFTVEDRCDGTLTRVRRGVVVVRDFRRRRSIRLRAGRSYLARAPR